MALFAIGDIQGCLQPLKALLAEMEFEPERDTLWLTGDLVNRGPDSLQVLRFVKALPNCVTVLGNHDLHLLAVAFVSAPQESMDTIESILHAPDRAELLDWLRHQPLLHLHESGQLAMIHAGLPPHWDVRQALSMAGEVEAVLQGDDIKSFLINMYGNKPEQWRPDLQGWDRLRYITNCFTRMRYIKSDSGLCLNAKGPPGTQPNGYRPWFQVPERLSRNTRVIFGHWSTLGYHEQDNVVALDSGCLWGQRLSGVRLDQNGQVLQQYHLNCNEFRHPQGHWM